MGHISRITQFGVAPQLGSLYEDLLAALGTEEFGDVVRQSINAVTGGVRRIYLMDADARRAAGLHYHWIEPQLAAIMPMYVDQYLARDPLNDAFQAAPSRRDMAMFRIATSEIEIHGYRRRFYEEPGIVERLSIFQRGADSWRVLSICRHESEGHLSDGEIDSLVGLASLLLPMVPRIDSGARRQIGVSQLECRFGRRYPNLTLRERQVCARAAIGMTLEGTALDLGIAKTSVQTYRQRAYKRLNVTSSYELGAMVSN